MTEQNSRLNSSHRQTSHDWIELMTDDKTGSILHTPAKTSTQQICYPPAPNWCTCTLASTRAIPKFVELPNSVTKFVPPSNILAAFFNKFDSYNCRIGNKNHAYKNDFYKNHLFPLPICLLHFSHIFSNMKPTSEHSTYCVKILPSCALIPGGSGSGRTDLNCCSFTAGEMGDIVGDAFDKVCYTFKSSNKTAVCSKRTQIYKYALPFLAKTSGYKNVDKKKEKQLQSLFVLTQLSLFQPILCQFPNLRKEKFFWSQELYHQTQNSTIKPNEPNTLLMPIKSLFLHKKNKGCQTQQPKHIADA